MEKRDDFASGPALAELARLRESSERPFVFWIGAGASSWAGIKRWEELAQTMRSEFLKVEPSFDKQLSWELIKQRSFPQFFGYCCGVSQTNYRRILDRELHTGNPRLPVYDRFLTTLRKLAPCNVLTTNADELLEQGLELRTVQPAAMECVPNLLFGADGFVAKLHGSICDPTSLIFTVEEYTALLANKPFINALSRALQASHVVFIGYGLADDYVLRLLEEANDLKTLFGDGPHFACLSGEHSHLPASVRIIRYSPEPHQDHRSVLTILEELSMHRRRPASTDCDTPSRPVAESLISAHFLTGIYPPGDWQSSQSFQITKAPEGEALQFKCYRGIGLTNQEFPQIVSTAMHDIVVGLLCFDRIVASSQSLGGFVKVVGERRALEMISREIVTIVHDPLDEILIFPTDEVEILGTLSTHSTSEPDGSATTSESMLRRQLLITKGKEKESEKLIEEFAEKVSMATVALSSAPELAVCHKMMALLNYPSIRRMLGMSGGVPSGIFPVWLKFPILRLANVIRVGDACRCLGVASAKLDFGLEALAAQVFGGGYGRESASQVASYVVAGRFSTDIGVYVTKNPVVLDAVLRFREQAQGVKLRSAILEGLAGSEGNEVAAAVNGGLRQMVPSSLIETARTSFTQLLVGEPPVATPAIWHDSQTAESSLKLWRKRSREEFRALCVKLGVGPYDQCPCGSGETMKFCCLEALDR